MLEELNDTELEAYLDENPQIIPLFEIDVLETATVYVPKSMLQEEAYEPDLKAMLELSRARKAFVKEIKISRRVTASALEEINIRTTKVPQLLSIAKDLLPTEKTAMTEMLQEFKDGFAWSHENMKGLDLKFYQHKINLAIDVKPVQ